MFAGIRPGTSFGEGHGRTREETLVAPESTTTSWTGDELATIGRADELRLASLRED